MPCIFFFISWENSLSYIHVCTCTCIPYKNLSEGTPLVSNKILTRSSIIIKYVLLLLDHCEIIVPVRTKIPSLNQHLNFALILFS